MEVYLVKEEVKIVPDSAAFPKTNLCNRRKQKCRNVDPRTPLAVSDLPVAFKSISNDDDPSWQSGRFAERMQRKLKKNPSDKFGNLKLELIISNHEDSLNGYFVLSSHSLEGSQTNVLKRLGMMEGKFDIEVEVEVTLCHLPTVESAVSPEALVYLKADLKGIRNSGSQDHMRSRGSSPIPPEMRKWWEQGTGFIYSKSSVKIKLGATSVNWAYGCSKGMMLPQREFTPVEIICKNGVIVKFCREFLEVESQVFRNKFEEMEKKREGEGGPLKLEMETSKKGVEAFLEYVGGSQFGGYGLHGISRGVLGCGLSLELLKIGRDYDLLFLENAMDELIMGKRSTDFDYFSVEGALGLFLFTRNAVGLKHLRDKSVRVLQNYLRTKSNETLESKEYQDLFENQPRVAMELSSLYLNII